jgi:prophage regulatory protein
MAIQSGYKETDKMAIQPISPMLLRLPSVCALVGLSKSQVYRLIKAGEFPAAIQLGANSVAWPAERVNAWIAEKIDASQS